MKTLTYDAYISDPAVRAQIEREARRMRAEAVQAGLRAMVRVIYRSRATPPVLKLKTA